MPHSKAALMREKKARGMSTGDIARLFGVSYHNAYQVVVVHAGANERTPAGSSSANSAIEANADFTALSWPELFAVIAAPAQTRAEKGRRLEATAEADRRDPSGTWLDKQALWEKASGHSSD